MSRLKILIWDVHRDYLQYLFQCPHDFYLISKASPSWPDNVNEVLEEDVKELDLNLVIFQKTKHFLNDQFIFLSLDQQKLPKIYLEHNLPIDNAMETHHFIDDPTVHMVHVTPFNDLIWDCGRTPTHVIDHGVLLPRGVQYIGDLPRGLVRIDHLSMGGRRLGLDIYNQVRRHIPLDLMGSNSLDVEGGLAETPLDQRAEMASHYRFLFNPARYTSLDLTVCEMMMIGMPIVGLATAEMAVTIRNGVSGYVQTDIAKLIENMKKLITDSKQAHLLGRGAYRYAHQRFNIKRFIQDWSTLLELVSNGFTCRSEIVGEERIRRNGVL